MSSWANLQTADLQSAATALTGAPADLPIRVDGGSNNRVYRVEAGQAVYALKLYWNVNEDPRDRLGTEYRALDFMRRHGVDCVPAPIALDRAQGMALYEWVDGDPVASPTDADLTEALDFVKTLYRLRTAAGADELPLASEACLSVAELVRQIASRLTDLEFVTEDADRLKTLIDAGIKPCFEHALAAAEDGYREAGHDFDADLNPTFRTLSPADFGFHNTRRTSGGVLKFLDFEYFGWDDPTKLATEFILHPGMSLSREHKNRFLAEVTDIYANDPGFATRVRLLFPLYGLRWCLIVLNEFLPERWAHRVEAQSIMDRDMILEKQLDKAEILLADVQESLERFPYGC